MTDGSAADGCSCMNVSPKCPQQLQALLNVLGAQQAGSARRHYNGSPAALQGVSAQLSPTAATPYFTPAASSPPVATAVTPVDAWHSIINTLHKSAAGHSQSPAERRLTGSPGSSSQGSSPSTVRQQLFQTDLKASKAGCTRLKAQTSPVALTASTVAPAAQARPTAAAIAKPVPQQTQSASPTTQQLAQRLERLRTSTESVQVQQVGNSRNGGDSSALRTAQRLYAAGVGGVGSSSSRQPATPIPRRLFSTPSKQGPSAQVRTPLLHDAAASPAVRLSQETDSAGQQQITAPQQQSTTQQQTQLAAVVEQMQELLLAVQAQQQSAAYSSQLQLDPGSQGPVNQLHHLVHQDAGVLKPERKQQTGIAVLAQASVEHTPALLQAGAPSTVQVLGQQHAMLHSLLHQQPPPQQQEQQQQQPGAVSSTAADILDGDQPLIKDANRAEAALAQSLSSGHTASIETSLNSVVVAAADVTLLCDPPTTELSGNMLGTAIDSTDKQPRRTAPTDMTAVAIPEVASSTVTVDAAAECLNGDLPQQAPLSSPSSSKPPLWRAGSGSPGRTTKETKQQQQSTSTVSVPAVGRPSSSSSSPRPVWKPPSANPSNQPSPSSSPRTGLTKQGSYSERYLQQQRSLKEEAARALSTGKVGGAGAGATDKSSADADGVAVEVQQLTTAVEAKDGADTDSRQQQQTSEYQDSAESIAELEPKRQSTVNINLPYLTSPSTPPAALPRVHTPGKDAVAAAAETVTPMLANSAAAVINLTEAWREGSQDTNQRWKQLLDEWSAEELPLQHTESSNNLLGNSSSSMLVSADHSAATASASPAEVQPLSAGAGNAAIADTVEGASKAQQQGSAEGMPQKQPEEGTVPEAMDGALRSPVQQMRESAVSPGSAFESEASELSLMAFRVTALQQPTGSESLGVKGPRDSPACRLFSWEVTPAAKLPAVQQLGTAAQGEGQAPQQQQPTMQQQQPTQGWPLLMRDGRSQHGKEDAAGFINTEDSFNQLLVGLRDVHHQLAQQHHQQQQQQQQHKGAVDVGGQEPNVPPQHLQQQGLHPVTVSSTQMQQNKMMVQPAADVQPLAATGCSDSGGKPSGAKAEGTTFTQASGKLESVQSCTTPPLSEIPQTVSPAPPPAAEDSFDRLLGSLQEVHDRLEEERRQQQQGALSEAAKSLLDTEDSFNQLLMSLRDVHDRLAAERQHREFKQRYKKMLQVASPNPAVQQGMGLPVIIGSSHMGISSASAAADASLPAKTAAREQQLTQAKAAAATADCVVQESDDHKQMSAADRRFLELRQRLQESRAALQAIALPTAPAVAPIAPQPAVLSPMATAAAVTPTAHHRAAAPQAAATAADASSTLALPASAWLRTSPLQQYLKHSRIQQGKPAAGLAAAADCSSNSKPQASSSHVQALVAKWRAESAAKAQSQLTSVSAAAGVVHEASPEPQQHKVYQYSAYLSSPVTTEFADTGNDLGISSMRQEQGGVAASAAYSTPWQQNQQQQQVQQASDALGLSPLSPLHTLSRTGAFGVAHTAAADAASVAPAVVNSNRASAAVIPAPLAAGVSGVLVSRAAGVNPATAAAVAGGALASPAIGVLFPMSPLVSSSTGGYPRGIREGTAAAASAGTPGLTNAQTASSALAVSTSVVKGASSVQRAYRTQNTATPISHSGGSVYSTQCESFSNSNSPPSVNMLQQWLRRGSPTKKTKQQLRSRAWQEQQQQQMQVQQQQLRQQLDSMQQAVKRMEQQTTPGLQKQQQRYDTAIAAAGQDGSHRATSASYNPIQFSAIGLSNNVATAPARSPAEILAAAAAEAEQTAAELAAGADSMVFSRPDSPNSRLRQYRMQQAADQDHHVWGLLDKPSLVKPYLASGAASAAASVASQRSQLQYTAAAGDAAVGPSTWLQSAALRRQQHASASSGLGTTSAAGYRNSNGRVLAGARAGHSSRLSNY